MFDKPNLPKFTWKIHAPNFKYEQNKRIRVSFIQISASLEFSRNEPGNDEGDDY